MNRFKVECIPKCFIVSFKRRSHSVKGISGEELYNRFITANSKPYWNLDLKDVLENCEFYGHVKPYNILLKAEDIFIQSLRLAQEKRLLKSPDGFIISFVGETEPTKCSTIQPSQFVALDEALCYIIYDLNLRAESSTFEIICTRLAEWYSGLQLPPQSLILATLRSLLNAGQVYYTGYGYNILTTDKAVVAQWLQEQSPHAPLARIEADPEELTRGSLTGQEDCCTEDDELAKENCHSNKDEDKDKESGRETGKHYLSQYPPAIFLAPANLSWDNARGYVIKDGYGGGSGRKKKGKSKSVVKNFFSRFRSATTSSSGIKASLSPRPRASTADFSYHDDKHHSHGNFPGIVVDDDDLDGFGGPLYAPASMMTQSVMSGTYGVSGGANLRSHVRQGHWLWHTSLQSLPPAEPATMPYCHGYPTSSPHHNAGNTQVQNQPQQSVELNPPYKASYNSLNAGRRSVSNHSRLSTQAIHDDSPPKRSTSFTHALSRHNKHSRRHRSNSGRHDSKGHSDRSSSKQRKGHKKSSSKKHHHSNSNHGDNEAVVVCYGENQGIHQHNNRNRKESGSNECDYENSGLLAGSSPPSVYRMKLALSGNYMLNYGGGGGGCDSGVHSVSGSQAPGVSGIVLVGGSDYYGYVPGDGTGNKRPGGNHRHFRSLELDPTVTGPRSSSFRSTNSKSNTHSKLSSKSFNNKLPTTSNNTQSENHTNNTNNSQPLDPVIESQNNTCSINRNRLSNSINNQSDYKRHVAFQDHNR